MKKNHNHCNNHATLRRFNLLFFFSTPLSSFRFAQWKSPRGPSNNYYQSFYLSRQILIAMCTSIRRALILLKRVLTALPRNSRILEFIDEDSRAPFSPASTHDQGSLTIDTPKCSNLSPDNISMKLIVRAAVGSWWVFGSAISQNGRNRDKQRPRGHCCLPPLLLCKAKREWRKRVQHFRFFFLFSILFNSFYP